MKSTWSADRSAGQRALLRFLQRQDRIPAASVASLEEKAQREGLSVSDLLEREKIITEKDLAVLLSTTLRLRLIDLSTYPLDPQVARELKENIATRYEVVPIRLDDGTIEVAIANPLDLEALKAVEFATGKRVQAVVATRPEVLDALAHAYRLQESLEIFLQHVPDENVVTLQEVKDTGTDLHTIAREAELPPVVKLADLILIEGIKSRASDVHVEPATDGVVVRYRIDGILEEAFRLPKWVQSALIARLKVMAKLDITERRVPQDGRIGLRYQDRIVDLRVSSLPAQHGEKITLRILDSSSAVHSIERIGLTATDMQRMRDAVRRPEGLILITGPTGSGKTTTLYALLREKISPNVNIVTIENPIEYQLKGINQVEINEKQGLTFAGVLRSVLRQDPDVILVGEIRDQETAQIAFQAAQTGHLVLSTVHTNDAAAAVTRLIDLGTEPYVIAAATNLIVAQRLVRRVCQSCSAPTTPSEDSQRLLHLESSDTIRRGAGCPVCRQTGFVGRTGVYEVLPITPPIAKLIEAGAGETAVRQQARAEGVKSLLEDAHDKLLAGTTTPEELLRVVQVSEQGPQCPGCQEDISEDYAVCPHCAFVLRATCGSCAKPLSAGWVTCPYCGSTAKSEGGAEAPVAATSELGGGEQPSRRQRTYKALVVDDNPAIRDIVHLTLEHSRLGLSVVTAQDGNEALQLAAVERPDVVVLDLQMPGLDGFEVCRRLRSDVRTAFVPILMLTAQVAEESISEGFAAGTDDYMTKPFRREDLIVRVRRMLERTYGTEATAESPPEKTAPSEAAKSRPAAGGDGPRGDRVAEGDEGGIERFQDTLARMTADREALAVAIQACQTGLAQLSARLDATTDLRSESPDASAALDDLRRIVEQELATQEHAVAAVRGEVHAAQRAVEAALQGVREGATALEARVGELAGVPGALDAVAADQRRTAHEVEDARRELEEARRAIGEWRAEQGRLESLVEGGKTSVPGGDEEAFLRLVNGCEMQLNELAARLDADVTIRSEMVAAEGVATTRRLDELDAAIERLRHEQSQAVGVARADATEAGRTTARVASRLEEVIADTTNQHAALAEIRTAIEGLRADQATLRSAADVPRASSTALSDAAAGLGDVFVGLCSELIDGAYQCVEAFASRAPWRLGIRRTFSLLVDSALTAVVEPALRQLFGSSDADS